MLLQYGSSGSNQVRWPLARAPWPLRVCRCSTHFALPAAPSAAHRRAGRHAALPPPRVPAASGHIRDRTQAPVPRQAVRKRGEARTTLLWRDTACVWNLIRTLRLTPYWSRSRSSQLCSRGVDLTPMCIISRRPKSRAVLAAYSSTGVALHTASFVPWAGSEPARRATSSHPISPTRIASAGMGAENK